MVKYLCHNCNDLLLKNISSVVNHVWDEHKIEITKKLQMVKRAEDARLPLKKIGIQQVSGFRCEECNVTLRDVPSFLVHLDKIHDIHIWYEKGLTRKRVFFDGILDDSPTEENRAYKKTAMSISKKSVPLSQRPYEPRKSDDEDLVKQHHRK